MSSQHQRFDELLGKSCDQSLSAPERTELADLLRQSSELRRRYVAFAQLDATLWLDAGGHSRHVPADVDDNSTSPKPEKVGGRAMNGAFARVLSIFSRPTPFSLTAAALVIGLLITAMAFMAPPFYRRMTRKDDSALQYRVVARLTGLHETVWGKQQTGGHLGAYLLAGQRFELSKGLVEVTYHDGATVILAGPCDYTIDGPIAGHLRHGSLTARIRESATGFTISTPAAQVEDFGTEFGVTVDADGSTRTSVFVGSVEMRLANGRANSVRILADQTALATASSLHVDKSPLIDSYVRTFPEDAPPAVSNVGLVNGDFTSPQMLHQGYLTYGDIDLGWTAKKAGKDWTITDGELIQQRSGGTWTRIGQVFRAHGPQGANWKFSLDLYHNNLSMIEVYAGQDDGDNLPEQNVFSLQHNDPPMASAVKGRRWKKLVALSEVTPGHVEVPISGPLDGFDLIAIRFIGNRTTAGAAVDNVRLERASASQAEDELDDTQPKETEALPMID